MFEYHIPYIDTISLHCVAECEIVAEYFYFVCKKLPVEDNTMKSVPNILRNFMNMLKFLPAEYLVLTTLKANKIWPMLGFFFFK